MPITLVKGDGHVIKVDLVASFGYDSGDLLYNDGTNGAKPGSDPALWNTNLATTQGAFCSKFIGSSNTHRPSTLTTPTQGTANPKGLHRYPIAATTQLEIGQYMGLAKGAGNYLDCQTLIAVSGPTLAVGRLAERALAGDTSVLIELFTQKLEPGVADF